VVGEENPGKALPEAFSLPLVHQLSLMQNQMFDQFREAMAMMFQMFGSLQKDQMEFVHRELGRIQELSHEMQTLQRELRKHPPSKSDQARFREPQAECDQVAGKQKVHRESKFPSEAETARSVAAAREGTVPPQPALAAITEEKAGPDVHSWLCQRMAEIQEDRRTRLQKILNFLSGK
jgi:hypothetical protein